MQRRKLIFAAAAAAASAPFLGASSAFAAEKTLRVGVTAGPSAQILEYVVPIAKELGLNVKIYEFQDYIQPNAALDAGDIDANIYCTKPFLDHENETRGYSLRIAAPAFTLPMAVYSKKIKSLKDLPQDATVGIPNDPAMGGRGLLLLAAGGLIKLREGSGLLPSKFDIVENPKNLKVVELEAAQLPLSLNDLTIACVNGNYAAVAGLNPSRDGLLVEGANGPYVCNIVVTEKNLNEPWVKTFAKAYQDPRVKEWILKKFEGSVIPGF